MLLAGLKTKTVEEQVGVAHAQHARQSEDVYEADGKVADECAKLVMDSNP